jgi:hypothetical protein
MQHGFSGQQLDCTQKAWFTVRQDIPGIYQVYTMHIPCKRRLRALNCPSALGSLRPGLQSDLLSFGHREASNARLGLSKVLQPGVDLINMASPPPGRACTIGTAALKRFSCLLLYFLQQLHFRPISFEQD